MVFRKKRSKQEHKYCPVCGTQLNVSDSYCTTCGYSFEARHKKSRKGIKWKNIVVLVIILLLIYIGFQYFTGNPIIPDSLSGLLTNSTNITK